MKVVNIIVKLCNLNEVNYLLSKGVIYGENGINKTHSNSGNTYYLCESRKNMRLLEDYRHNIICRK